MFDTLRNYIVKIGYDGKHAGSGVIIKKNGFSDSFYIFTAKHLFFDKKMKITEMKIKDITKKISIDNPFFDIQDNIKLEPFEINNEYDFLIIKVSNCRIEETLLTNIFMDKMDSKTNLSIMGFPHIRDENETDYNSYPCTYKHICKNEKNFEIDSKKILTVRDKEGNANHEISGLSGSGVYLTTDDKEVSIVGILIESATGQGIVCFDLRSIIDEIHEKIDIEEKVYETLRKIFIDKVDSLGTESVYEVNKGQILKNNHILYKNGYIEPRTVNIEEFDINIAVCSITVEEYHLFCKSTNIKMPYGNNLKKNKRPAINIDWNHAQKYCKWLQEKTTKLYRLPTSKEWESIALLNMPDNDLEEYIVCREDFKKNPKIAKVGSKKAGKLSIFDRHVP